MSMLDVYCMPQLNWTIYYKITIHILFFSAILLPVYFMVPRLPQLMANFSQVLESKLYNFLLNSKVDRIKRATMIASYEEGGLKMIDSRNQCKALKLKWIKYIKTEYKNTERQDFWYAWVRYCLPKIDVMDFLKCNLNKKDVDAIC